MSELIWVLALGVSVWYMRSQISHMAENQMVDETLSGKEKCGIGLLALFNPLLAGAIFYYGWRKKLPVKAKQANVISFFAFFTEIGIAFLIVFVLHLFNPARLQNDIFFAIGSNDVKSVQDMLRQNPALAQAPHHGETMGIKDGWLPLHFTAGIGQKEEILDLLTQAGAAVDAKDSEGQTPLEVAAANGNEAMVKALLAHHASVRSVDENGDTPLHAVGFQGSIPIAQTLLAAGADINAKDKNNDTAMQVAIKENHPDLADFLRKCVSKKQ